MLLLPPKEFLKQIALRVRALRLDNGWSQRELANRAGVSVATYQLFERTGQVSFERLYRIAIGLHRHTEFDALFLALPLRDIDELLPKPSRKHGRTSS